MWKVLKEKSDFVLVEGEKGFFAFGNRENLRCPWGFPVDQCGTKEEVKEELERWKNEIDFNNPCMIEIENCFIGALDKN